MQRPILDTLLWLDAQQMLNDDKMMPTGLNLSAREPGWSVEEKHKESHRTSLESVKPEATVHVREVEQCAVDNVSLWDSDDVRRSSTITLVTFVLSVWMIFLFIVFSVSGPITPRETYQQRVVKKETLQNKKAPPPRKKNIEYEPNSVLLTLSMATKVTEGSGTTKEHKSINGFPLRINGTEYAHGIGTHAESEIIVPLNQKFKRFVADVGIDDEVYRSPCGLKDANAVFQLIADDKIIYKSGLLKHTNTAKPVNVSVKGVKVLRLVVLGRSKGNFCDRADWAAARFII